MTACPVSALVALGVLGLALVYLSRRQSTREAAANSKLLRESSTAALPCAEMTVALAVSEQWRAHAYPLQQVTIRLQGNRFSEYESVIGQMEAVLSRLRAGDVAGMDHDDDYGYSFTVDRTTDGPSFFDAPAGRA